MFKYHCLNPISAVGMNKLDENYVKTENADEADVILVRSAKMHEMEFGKNLKAIARAGAGVNNIPLDKCADICGTDAKGMEEAQKMIHIIVTDFEAGQVLEGKVVSIKDFGAFLEFAPGKEGMVHISKLSKERVNRVEDVYRGGDWLDFAANTTGAVLASMVGYFILPASPCWTASPPPA